MSKEENVVKYYVLCNKLKDVIRTGWKDWNVKRDRIESVAEHIYGVQMLAIAMKSEFHYKIDLQKTILMISIHELEEICIGDLTQFQISPDKKEKLGHKAVKEVLGNLLSKEYLNKLILEFDSRETKEAKFAYYCDKLECDLQSKLYDEEECVDLNKQDGNKTMEDGRVKSLLESGKNFSEMWMLFGQQNYNYDKNFKKVSDFALKSNIKKYKK